MNHRFKFRTHVLDITSPIPVTNKETEAQRAQSLGLDQEELPPPHPPPLGMPFLNSLYFLLEAQGAPPSWPAALKAWSPEPKPRLVVFKSLWSPQPASQEH